MTKALKFQYISADIFDRKVPIEPILNLGVSFSEEKTLSLAIRSAHQQMIGKTY
jgi:hypothetical protein